MDFRIFLNIKKNPTYKFFLFITFAFFGIILHTNSTRHKDSNTIIRFLYFAIKDWQWIFVEVGGKFCNIFCGNNKKPLLNSSHVLINWNDFIEW